jgi:Spt4/RpoE2 zinc finger
VQAVSAVEDARAGAWVRGGWVVGAGWGGRGGARGGREGDGRNARRGRAQFLREGCDNCARLNPLPDKESRRREWVESETTAQFNGVVALTAPDSSWVARWARLYEEDSSGNRVFPLRGVYAMSLPGEDDAEADAAADDAYAPEEEDQYAEELGEDHRDTAADDAQVRNPDDEGEEDEKEMDYGDDDE